MPQPRPARLLLMTLLAVLAASGCRDDATEPRAFATLAVVPLFDAAATQQVATIRLTVERYQDEALEVVVDTTVTVQPGQTEVEVVLTVPLESQEETVLLTLLLSDASGNVLFVGGPISLVVSAGGGGGGEPIPVPLRPFPNELVILSGDAQVAPISSPLPLPLEVQVLDAEGAGLADVLVSFTASAGTLSATSVLSDAEGLAQTTWTLGGTEGTQSVAVTVSDNPSLGVSFSATALLPPQPGADVVVFNDMNLFDETAMQDPNNLLLVGNLVSFTTTGPRNSATEVWFDYGRGSVCASVGECGASANATMTTVMQQAGFTVTTMNSSGGSLTTIPSQVKAIFLWNPTVVFTSSEVAALRQFAGEGGRIVLIGEWDGFYTAAGIATENQLLLDLGAQMTNTGGAVDCGYVVLPQSSLRSHQITQGLTGVTLACASVIQPGPQDFPLVYDLGNTQLLAGVATVPATIPAPAPRSDAERLAAFEAEVRRLEAQRAARPTPGSISSRGPR